MRVQELPENLRSVVNVIPFQPEAIPFVFGEPLRKRHPFRNERAPGWRGPWPGHPTSPTERRGAHQAPPDEQSHREQCGGSAEDFESVHALLDHPPRITSPSR